MAYQVLARKWRPQTFSSLVGQGAIVTALRNALMEGRLAQAYLFSGIRGVGKTTAARLLAKALNCERGPRPDPCNECTPCLEITRGSDLDVIEVDAATYSKVEQVRELTEGLKYGPSRDRYKVVILDEIHRLSRQAFDALLKIVEEPPPHLVFIFATTEIEAVPATILSRCQEFRFRRVPGPELSAHLREICAAEGIEASDTALRLIARAGEGSVRDSVALLDQLATFGSGAISDDEAVRLLGGLDTALFARLLQAILGGDALGVGEVVARVEEEGWDPHHVYTQFLAYARNALHLAMGGDPGRSDLPGEEAAALAEIARGAGYENLLRLLNLLLAGENLIRRSESGVLAVEIAWLRAAELPKLIRIEELLGEPGASRGASAPARTAVAPSAPPPRPAPVAPPPAAVPEKPAPPPVRTEAPPPPAPLPRPAGGDPVRALLDELSRLKQPLAAHLEEAEDLSFADGCLQIVYPPGDEWLATKLSRGNNRELLEQALANVFGAEARWQLAEGQGKGKKTEAAALTGVKLELVAENPTVQTLLDIFGGKVEKVEDHLREEQPE